MLHMASRTVTTKQQSTEEDVEVEKAGTEVDREEEEIDEQPILLQQSCKTEEEEEEIL